VITGERLGQRLTTPEVVVVVVVVVEWHEDGVCI